jgi:uridine kinase
MINFSKLSFIILYMLGLSCSGKTHLAENLRKVLGENECLMISMVFC